MKKTFKVLGIVAFVVALGFLFASCDSNGGSGSSTGGGSGPKEVLATVYFYDGNGVLMTYNVFEYETNGRTQK
jgi:hypothetical protein